jgi:hypothetical protein
MEPGGVERHGFPLTVGLPFSRGVLGREEAALLTDGEDRSQLPQTRTMETHSDGSVKWLLLDYRADMPPLGKVCHRLALGGTGRRRGPAIGTEERGSLIHVDNGAMHLAFDTETCQPVLRMSRNGETVSEGGLSFQAVSRDGTTYYASGDDGVGFEIEEQGPLRWLVRWEGTHRDEGGSGYLDFLVRMTIFAGNPFIRVDHTLINRLDPPVTQVREVAAELPIQVGSDPDFSVADVYRPPTVFPADGPVRLEQDDLGHFRVLDRSGRTLKEEGDNSMGWVDVSGRKHGILLAGKSFWQNYPKAIAADESSVRVQLIPDREVGFPIPRGMAKTHTFFVYLHDGGIEPHRLADLAFQVQRWPMPAAPSQYYEESGQLWDFFPHYPREYPRLEAALRNMYDPDQNHFPRITAAGRAYGLKHYGDFVVRRGSSPDPDAPDAYYLNNEYDTPHVLAMMFLRTREIMKWWGAEAHALHMMDVDTCHHAVALEHLEDPADLLGCQYRHCYQHVGSIQVPGDERHIPASGSHTFAEGLLDYYHLTGDRRALDVARGYARNLVRIFSRHEPIGVGRYSGWGLLVLGGVYMVSPDEEIRAEADRVIEKTISQQGEGGGILRATVHPRAFEDRLIHLCMRGLIKWHQATGDAKVRKLILELMEAYLRTGLIEEGLPLYSTWPENSKATTPMQGFANLESLAYAYDLTGHRRFIDAGIPGLCQAIEWITHPDEADLHNNFQRILRGPFRFMAIAHKLGILGRVPGAGRWLEESGSVEP